MFRSLSLLGTLFIIAFIALVVMLGLKAYNIYQGNYDKSIFADSEGNTPRFMEKIYEIGGKSNNKDKIANNKANSGDLDEKELKKDLESAFNDEEGDNNEYGIKSRSDKSTKPEGGSNENKSFAKNAEGTNTNSTTVNTSAGNSTSGSGVATAVAVSSGSKTERAYLDSPSQKKYKSQKVSYKPNMNGGYLVVAGSFSLRSNALTRMQDLSSLGFTASEIVQFEGSVLESVVAGRFNDMGEASKIVNALKSDYGVEAYVIKI